MTRKDYRAIASHIRRELDRRQITEDAARQIAAGFVASARADNPRFDRIKFYAAAGVLMPRP